MLKKVGAFAQNHNSPKLRNVGQDCTRPREPCTLSYFHKHRVLRIRQGRGGKGEGEMGVG